MRPVNRLLLCTDMDRTVIPNGHQREHLDARPRFRQLCSLTEVCLVYVSGRHLQLVQQAISAYDLPQPDYVITDVGTKIYQQLHGHWHEMLNWQQRIAKDWQGKTAAQLQAALQLYPALTLQEHHKQSKFKLSYYLALNADKDKIMAAVATQMAQLGVDVSLIWSVDEPAHIALLDILPRNATKLEAIQFLQRQLEYTQHQVMFAGDSGNDIPVLASSIQAIVVANATAEIKRQAQQLTQQSGYEHTLYLADNNSPLGGNYAAGVVQGVLFFAPQLGTKLELA